jgi:Ring finger domain
MQFGTTIQRIMRETLAEWASAMRIIMKETAPYKSLKERESVIKLMEYLEDLHHKYEGVYGLMEEISTFGKVIGSTVHIQSTGYGVKILCGLLMADRLHVIERFRSEERERICFERMDNSDLPADCKNCSVCQDPLDTMTPEGTLEQGLKLIICCHQIIGENCLKEWLARSGPSIKKNCPNCRFDFPLCFLAKLFGEGYKIEVDPDEEEDDMEDIVAVQHLREVYSLSPVPDQSPEPPGSGSSRLERSPAPSPAVESSYPTIITNMSLSPSPSPPPAAAAHGPVAEPPSMLGAVFLNPVHTNISRGADGMAEFANAWTFGGPQVDRVDDFRMEG